MPTLPIKCTPCLVTYEGVRYHVKSNGEVWTWVDKQDDEQLSDFLALHVRRDASRQRRNRNARQRNEVYRDLGMKRTAYGWE